MLMQFFNEFFSMSKMSNSNIKIFDLYKRRGINKKGILLFHFFTNILSIKKKMSNNNTVRNTSFSSTSTSTFTTTTTTSTTTTTPTTNPTIGTTGTTIRARRRTVRTAIPPVTWNEQELRLLIDQRKNRNAEYYQIIGRSRVDFWNSVARRINRVSSGSNFTGIQCRRRFENFVTSYNVS